MAKVDTEARMITVADFDLELLVELETKATRGPWYVSRFDDEHFMSAISIEAYPGNQREAESEVIAATLIQQPPYITPSDDKWIENANLIAAARNALPELLRLAAIGAAAEKTS